MNDNELAKLAEEYRAAKERVNKAKAKADKLAERLTAEMVRRKTRGIITHGLKITLVAPQTVDYIVPELQRRLKGKWELVTETVFSRDKLSAAVQEGLISPKLVEKCSVVKDKKPYVLVTPEEE